MYPSHTLNLIDSFEYRILNRWRRKSWKLVRFFGFQNSKLLQSFHLSARKGWLAFLYVLKKAPKNPGLGIVLEHSISIKIILRGSSIKLFLLYVLYAIYQWFRMFGIFEKEIMVFKKGSLVCEYSRTGNWLASMFIVKEDFLIRDGDSTSKITFVLDNIGFEDFIYLPKAYDYVSTKNWALLLS